MSDRLVNVIANVDLKRNSAKILYVNPMGGSTSEPTAAKWIAHAPVAELAGAAAGAPMSGATGEFELRVDDGQGVELSRYRPTLKLSRCEPSPEALATANSTGSVPQETTGLIDEVIPFVEGMHRVVLLRNGEELARFESGDVQPMAGPSPALSIDAGASPHRRTLRSRTERRAGVKFTIQVKPEGAKAWQTIAVGRETPEVQFDSNQFPGAKKARVRVLRSTGFDDEVYSEQELDLDF